MSRGGTKRSRAEQDRRRRSRERTASAEASKRAKREPRPKQGRGKAIALHLMSLAAPFLMAAGLVVSGQLAEAAAAGDSFWLDGVMNDPNAPYWQEPAGFLLMAAVWALAAGVFWLLMMVGWKRIYRTTPLLDRDWSSVDQSFTLLAATAVTWLARALFGFTLAMESIIVMVSLMTLYVPLFSAGLALVLPVVPGSGRIGGVLPTFLKIPFTQRVVLDDEQRRDVAAAQATIKAASEAARAADQAERDAKRAAKQAAKKK